MAVLTDTTTLPCTKCKVDETTSLAVIMATENFYKAWIEVSKIGSIAYYIVDTDMYDVPTKIVSKMDDYYTISHFNFQYIQEQK